MQLDLTDEETAALLRELEGLINGHRYFLSPRIKTLKAIRAKIRPEPVREPLPPPPKRYEPSRATPHTFCLTENAVLSAEARGVR